MLPLLARRGLRCGGPAPLLRRPLVSRPSSFAPPRPRPALAPPALSTSLALARAPPAPSRALSVAPTANPVVPPPTPPTAPTALDRVLPRWAAGAKPYLLLTRIDKPIGSILLFWPCAWSITMASTAGHLPPSVPAFYLGLFALGAVVMRGAGCTINDMWDARIDAAVERTRARPIAAGDVSQLGALTFLGAQLGVGLAVLTQLNLYSILLGASSLSLVVIYPFMKRITYFPQVVLGFAFNWGALLGWSAVAGAVDWAVATPLYLGGVAWCVMYDTIYAHQDKKDDVLVGVKSTALRFPTTSRAFITGLSATFVSLLTLAGHVAGAGPAYYALSCAGAAAHLAWQCAAVDFDSRADCWKKFCSNGWLGGIVWAGTVADYVQQVVLPMFW